jgi:hypothetical protein
LQLLEDDFGVLSLVIKGAYANITPQHSESFMVDWVAGESSGLHTRSPGRKKGMAWQHGSKAEKQIYCTIL